jgi:hypothetical protein
MKHSHEVTDSFCDWAAKTLFMSAANSKALLCTRSGKKMCRRSLDFPDAHAALDWCLNCHAAFVFVPQHADPKLN